jgi:outer membrane protein TolC
MNRFERAIIMLLIFLPLIYSTGYGADDLTWGECVRLAKANNPQLISSREIIRQNRAAVGAARSGYLPQISANLGASISKQNGGLSAEARPEDYSTSTGVNRLLQQGGTTSGGRTAGSTTGSGRTESYSYEVTGSQMLFDGLKTVYDVRSAQSLVDYARYQYTLASSQLRHDLRLAFVQLLKAQESIGISKEIVARWKKNRALVLMRYKAGREHRGSLMNAEANLAQAQYQLLQSQRSVAVAQRGLLRQMGIYSFLPVHAYGSLAAAAVRDRNRPDFNDILNAHPLLLQTVKKKESALYDEKSQIAGLSPVISATGSAGRAANQFPPKTTSWSAGIKATLPIFDGGSRYYGIEKARAAHRQAEADEMSIREQVISDLEEKWTAWQNAIDFVGVQRKFLAAAEERARIAEAEYSIGLVQFDNWIIIEDDLAQKKRAYLDAKASELNAEAEWLLARGETLDYEK